MTNRRIPAGPAAPRRFGWVIALLLVVLAAGCGAQASSGQAATTPTTSVTTSTSPLPTGTTTPSAGSIPVGTSSHSLTVGGLHRTFLVYRPADLPDSAIPMVLMFHGGTGSAAQAERSYGWNAAASAHRFLMVYPQGTFAGWSTGGGCCGKPAEHHVDDVAYTQAVVAAVEGSLPIDRRRLYATGMSEGALMDYDLACSTSLFAAIAPVSGTELASCHDPTPLSVMDVHGTADPRIPYDGSTGAGINHINGPPVLTLNATWRGIDHCSAPTSRTQGPVTTLAATCPSGRGVVEVTIHGGGHHWPGSHTRPTTSVDRTDPYGATAAIADFFAAHQQP